MDTTLAIKDAILTYLLEDNTLTTIMGNSNIRVGEGIRSDKFPYLTFNIKSNIEIGSVIIMSGRVDVHLWDKKDLTDRIHEMRGRTIKLLDNETFPISGGEAEGVRLFFDSDIDVPDDTEFVHHTVILFTIKYVRSGDLNI